MMSEEEQKLEGDPVEQEARSHGWRPKEEFEADEKNTGKRWRTAEDFMDRKSLFDKIDEVKNENKTLRKGIQSLAEHNAKVEKSAYEKALATLKAERQQALDDEDLVRAERIRDQMDEVKEKMDSVQAPAVAVETPPAIQEWKQANPWYQKDEVMTVYADGIGNRLAMQGMPPELVLKEVERRVRDNFPERFRNPNKDVAPKVEVGVGARASRGPRFEMTDDERRIMNNLIRAGAPIKEDEYIAQLKKLKGQ
jgi:hypothetical protein